LTTNSTGLFERATERSSRRRKTPRGEGRLNANAADDADGGSDTADSVRLCYLGTRNARARALLESFESHRYRSTLITSGKELGTASCQHVGVVVVDGDEQPDLVATLCDIAESAPDAKIMVLARFESGDDILTALYAGASGFCDSSASPEAVARSVDDVIHNGAAIPRSFASDLVTRLREGGRHVVQGPAGAIELTDREWEVLSLLHRGRTTSEIAADLYVSPGTIRSHIWALVHKCGVDDRQALVDVIDAA
jgi:DNA-binding NarL/FixJ family response regulator